jgi:hypothetical protein
MEYCKLTMIARDDRHLLVDWTEMLAAAALAASPVVLYIRLTGCHAQSGETASLSGNA